jgi:TP901 family phage tail tape measure protein
MALPGGNDVRIVISAKDDASGVLGRVGNSIGGLARGIATAVAGATAAVAGLGAISLKTAISVESAFAGVAKTTEGLIGPGNQITEVGEEIRDAFRDLAKEVPVAVEELMGIGELAGQLGVPREALVDFTETVAALSVTTNLTAEEAAADLARLANIYQISAEDMAANTEQVGSTLVDLGNQFATTERDILAFGERIAGVGKIAGLTQADVLAIGTAMASVGVEAEAGGTAVQKVLIAMQTAVAEGGDELDTFVKATGLTVKEFTDAWEVDAAGVFEQFVLELGDMGDEAILTLKELGLEDQRLVRSFLSLAGAGDLITRTLDTSSEAFETNEALAKEAELRYGTMESQLVILKNTLRDVATTTGLELIPFLQDAVDFVKPFIEEFGERLPGIMEEHVKPAIDTLITFFSEDLPEAAGQVAEFLAPAIEGLESFFGAIIESAPEAQTAFGELVDWIGASVAPEIEQMVEDVGDILDLLGQLWEDNSTGIIGIVKFLIQTIITTITGGLRILLGTVEGILRFLVGDWEGAHEAIIGSLEGFFDMAASIVGTNLEEMRETWQGVWDNFLIIVETIWNNIVEAINSAVDEIFGVVDGISEAFSNLGQGFENLLKRNLGPLWPDSPTEFEIGIRGIAAAFDELKRSTDAAFRPIEGLPGGLADRALGTIAGGTEQHDHWRLTINSRARREDLVGSFETMRAMREGAV